ncbi:MAG: CarD family transcriptional regulator [Caulobacteraceae bacterium]
MTNSVDGFAVSDHVVYPAHGVGQIQAVETQEVAGISLEVYVITFDHEKMTLRVPTRKAKTAGLRSLAGADVVTKAMTTLKGRARVKRTMWSRRAQEYEAKINSGDLISIAEVVRDLHRADNQPEQSYSERQLYESALDRMAREVAAIEQIDRDAAVGLLTKSLVKAA